MDQIGKYKVLGELGRGGFGAVYLCEDNLRQKVAVKVFDPKDDVVAGMATSATSDAGEVLKQRFQDEAVTLRKLSSNPYIVDLYDFDETEDGIAYYVMPYLQQSLVSEIGRDVFSVGAQAELSPEELPRRISVARAIQILTQILEAMKTVHEEGLVHRDLKPANILFDKEGPAGKVQVCDFGIAKLPDTEHSQSGVGMGSRNYMSKEQRESAKHVDARSDVYAIGVIAYRMLTGTLPEGRFQDPIVYAPAIGQPLNDLIISTISVEASDRPENAGEFLKALKGALTSIEANAPLNEVTGTWVEQGESSIRDDLKPLRDHIEKLLLENGEIPRSEFSKLEALAAIADLDAVGIEALITQVSDARSAELKPVLNFLKYVDQQIARNSVDISALLVAGEAIGWSETAVNDLIAEKLSRVESRNDPLPPETELSDETTASTESPEDTDTGDKRPKRRKRMGIILLCGVILTIGFIGYTVWEMENFRLSMKPLWAIEEQNRVAWEHAESANTVRAYEAILALPSGRQANKDEATRRISLLRAGKQTGSIPIGKPKPPFTPRKIFKECDFCPQMVVLPIGSFQMGSVDGEDDELPIHDVTISQPIAMSRFELTFEAYDTFAVATGRALPRDGAMRRGERPVVKVTWNDAKAYVSWLSAQTGETYRLPSESEWEYAARAGTTSKYSWGNEPSALHANGNDTMGWPADGYPEATAVVGSFKPNAFGLYDMHGNVWEFTEDCRTGDFDYEEALVDGSARVQSDCENYIRRGGGWRDNAPSKLRSANRGWNDVSGSNILNGFRIVREL